MLSKIRALKEKKGFTLVELIVVLVILAILAALLVTSTALTMRRLSLRPVRLLWPLRRLLLRSTLTMSRT